MTTFLSSPVVLSLATDQAVERLGWVLIHSLWQFTVIALLAATIVRWLQCSSASVRYGVLVAALFASILAPAVTWQLVPVTDVDLIGAPIANGVPANSDMAPRAAVTSQRIDGLAISSAVRDVASDSEIAVSDSLRSNGSVAVVPATPWWQRARTMLEPWLGSIVAVWLIGVAVGSLRPLLGWQMLRRLRVVGVSSVSLEIQQAVKQISQRLGLARSVTVLQSTLVNVPVVAGYLRPVILLPLSLLTNIPPTQLESILAHELAHIRRHDFVINLLQTIVETLCFYHPGVWWISHRLRIERENCCDDLVVAMLDNHLEYGRALLAIAELRRQPTSLALGIADGSLLARIRRILRVGSDDSKVRFIERWPVALFSLLGCGLAIVWSFSMTVDAKDPKGSGEILVAKLPGKIQVELVGIGFHPSQGRQWWRPDGTKLDKRPELELSTDSGSKSVLPNSPEQQYCREFLFQIHGLPGDHSVVTDYGPSASAAGAIYDKSIWVGDHAAGPFKRPTTSVRIGLTTEPYGPTLKIDSDGRIQNENPIRPDLAPYYKAVQPLSVQEAEGRVVLHVRPKPYEGLFKQAAFELHAIDLDGQEYRIAGEQVPADGDRQLSFKLSRQQLSHFEFRLRPYRQWVTFENISLEPGKITQATSTIQTEAVEHPALQLLDSEGTPAHVDIVRPSIGFSKSSGELWHAKPSQSGKFALDVLSAGTHWMIAGVNTDRSTVFPITIPSRVAMTEQRLRPIRVRKLTDYEVSTHLEPVDGVESLHVKVTNTSDNDFDFSAEEITLTTHEGDLDSHRIWSPRLRELADQPLPLIHLKPQLSQTVVIKWPEWVRDGLWSDRVHEDIDEPWGFSEPGKIQVRAELSGYGTTPKLLTSPQVVLDRLPFNASQQRDAGNQVPTIQPDDAPTATGIVISPEGKPIPGISIVAFQGGIRLNQSFVSDEQGQFRVPASWRDSDHYLTLVARDGQDRLGWFDFFFHGHSDNGQKPEDGPFKLVLLPMNHAIRGKLVDDAGHGLANIPLRVEYLQHDVNFAAVHWRYQTIDNKPVIAGTTTDQNGEYELKLPAKSFAWLSPVHLDWVSQRIAVAKDKDALPAITLAKACKIVGQVIDSRTGKPVAGARIAAQAGQVDLQTGGWGDATTGADGKYTIGGLSGGGYMIYLTQNVERTLTAPALTAAELTSDAPFIADFALAEGKRVTGSVVSAETNLPITGCTISYSGAAHPGGQIVQNDDNSKFEFFVPPGRCTLTVGDNRLIVEGRTTEIVVPEDGDPDPVVLKAGPLLDDDVGKVKIFVGPALERKVSMDFHDTPLIDALEKLCQSAAVKLELEEDRLTAADYSKDTAVTASADRVSLRTALTQVLAPFERLSFTMDGNKVFVSTRIRVDARERTVQPTKVD